MSNRIFEYRDGDNCVAIDLESIQYVEKIGNDLRVGLAGVAEKKRISVVNSDDFINRWKLWIGRGSQPEDFRGRLSA